MIRVMSLREQTNVLTRNKPGYRSFPLGIFEQIFKTVILLTVTQGVSFQTFTISA